jgi:hypothetical protein
MARYKLLIQHDMFLRQLTFCLFDTDRTDLRSLINSWIGEDIQVVLQSTNKQVGLTETRVLIFGQRPVQLVDMASPLLIQYFI